MLYVLCFCLTRCFNLHFLPALFSEDGRNYVFWGNWYELTVLKGAPTHPLTILMNLDDDDVGGWKIIILLSFWTSKREVRRNASVCSSVNIIDLKSQNFYNINPVSRGLSALRARRTKSTLGSGGRRLCRVEDSSLQNICQCWVWVCDQIK